MTDAQLIKYAADFREGLLDGKGSTDMCFAICSPLASMLELLAGVAVELVESEVNDKAKDWLGNHYWIRLSDGRALDPTIDQFDESLGEVYLGEPLWMHNAT